MLLPAAFPTLMLLESIIDELISALAVKVIATTVPKGETVQPGPSDFVMRPWAATLDACEYQPLFE